jgi:tRNA (guanosine-2'-O-)-methyltransferase
VTAEDPRLRVQPPPGGRPSAERILRMQRVLERRQEDLEVVLENVHDPHNASAVVRSADAFAAGSVGLCYWIEEPPEVNRHAAAFTQKWTVFHDYDSPQAAADAIHARGQRLVVTSLDPDATPHAAYDWTQPTAVALGNEQRGTSDDLTALADARVRIDMSGFAQSLNISVAAAIILATAHQQRTAAGLLTPRWSDSKQALLMAWVGREQVG